MKPTKQEILAEIDKLAAMKPRVRPSSMFGDDHHAAIDAQLRVLREAMGDEDIDEEFGDDDNLHGAACEARDYVSGDVGPPSDEWASLVREG